jgi:hypothetical protein
MSQEMGLVELSGGPPHDLGVFSCDSISPRASRRSARGLLRANPAFP